MQYAYIANTKSKQSTKSAPLSVYAWHAYTRGNEKKSTHQLFCIIQKQHE